MRRKDSAMKKIFVNAQEKATKFYNDHKFEIVAGAIAVGAWMFYSKSLDYNKIFNCGYKCRVDFEKACDADTGSNIVDILKAYDA